jgi:ABC-type glycerol-3-phosphate transport system permease component
VATAGGERIEWELLMVMTLITGIPPVILYMLTQRHLSKTFAAAT